MVWEGLGYNREPKLPFIHEEHHRAYILRGGNKNMHCYSHKKHKCIMTINMLKPVSDFKRLIVLYYLYSCITPCFSSIAENVKDCAADLDYN